MSEPIGERRSDSGRVPEILGILLGDDAEQRRTEEEEKNLYRNVTLDEREDVFRGLYAERGIKFMAYDDGMDPTKDSSLQVPNNLDDVLFSVTRSKNRLHPRCTSNTPDGHETRLDLIRRITVFCGAVWESDSKGLRKEKGTREKKKEKKIKPAETKPPPTPPPPPQRTPLDVERIRNDLPPEHWIINLIASGEKQCFESCGDYGGRMNTPDHRDELTPDTNYGIIPVEGSGSFVLDVDSINERTLKVVKFFEEKGAGILRTPSRKGYHIHIVVKPFRDRTKVKFHDGRDDKTAPAVMETLTSNFYAVGPGSFVTGKGTYAYKDPDNRTTVELPDMDYDGIIDRIAELSDTKAVEQKGGKIFDHAPGDGPNKPVVVPESVDDDGNKIDDKKPNMAEEKKPQTDNNGNGSSITDAEAAKGIAEENESEMTAAITKEYERRRKNRKERDEYRGRSKAEKEEKGRASRSPHDEGFRNSEYYRDACSYASETIKNEIANDPEWAAHELDIKEKSAKSARKRLGFFDRKSKDPYTSGELRELDKAAIAAVDYIWPKVADEAREGESWERAERADRINADPESSEVYDKCIARLRKIRQDERSIEKLYDAVKGELAESGKGEFLKGGEKYGVLLECINEALDSSSDKIRVACELLLKKYRFCHLVGDTSEDEYNLYIYVNGAGIGGGTGGGVGDSDKTNDDNESHNTDIGKNLRYWDENSLSAIHKILRKESITKWMASRKDAQLVKEEIIASRKALEVRYDRFYRDERKYMIIDPYGNYADIRKGRVKEIDPSIHFYRNPDVNFKLDEDMMMMTSLSATKTAIIPEEGGIFLDFLKARFGGAQWRIALDYLAGVFLHKSILGSKPKMLTMIGEMDLYKSFVIEIMKGMIYEGSWSDVSQSASDKDIFSEALLRDCILNITEEEDTRPLKNPAKIKDICTKLDGKVRIMHNDKQAYAWRMPYWIIGTNTIKILPEDDNEKSILRRQVYLDMMPIREGVDRDWRSAIRGDRMMRTIMMMLIGRAIEIYNDPASICTQSIEETQAMYENKSVGGVRDVINKLFTLDVSESVGTSMRSLRNVIRGELGSTIPNAKLIKILEKLGFDVTKTRVKMRIDPVTGFEYCDMKYSHEEYGDASNLLICQGLKQSKRGKKFVAKGSK